MDKRRPIAGIVLAGGRSSRMGQNKALLEYQGISLIEHMGNILKNAGIEQIFIGGNINDYCGCNYNCLPDPHPFAGPAEAMKSIIKHLSSYAGLLFIPVDMPLLKPEMLHILLQQKDGGYFIDWPLPTFITPPFIQSDKTSVHGLLTDYGIYPIELPERFSPFMKNANTPQDWHEVLKL